MEYSKRTIEVADHRDVDGVLRTISHLRDVVVVNISKAGDVPAVFLSELNLRAVLADAPTRLFLEALPVGEYRKRLKEKVERVVEDSGSLRALLGSRHASDLAAESLAFLAELDQLALLLQSYTLQTREDAIGAVADTLRHLRAQLAASLESGDGVRGMDDLHYEILPALNVAVALFDVAALPG